MRRALLACLPACLLALAGPPSAEAGPIRAQGSPLALPLLAGGERPTLILAQRTIDRSWGLSEDSTYVEISVPGWKSESGAMALSAAIPGAGQLYVGERSGWLFVVAEAAGWFEDWYMRRRGRQIRDDAIRYAGDPNDSLSRFSFQVYEARTGRDASDLEALYAADRNLFYYVIGRDERYRSGWADDSAEEIMRDQFISIREDAEVRFKRARYFEAALWVNHLLAAADAWHAARTHNLPLGSHLRLKLGGRWRAKGPAVAAAVERSF